MLSRGPNIFLLLRGREPALTAHSSFFLVSQPPLINRSPFILLLFDGSFFLLSSFSAFADQQKPFFQLSNPSPFFIVNFKRGAFFKFSGSFSLLIKRSPFIRRRGGSPAESSLLPLSQKKDDARILFFHFNFFSVELLGTIF